MDLRQTLLASGTILLAAAAAPAAAPRAVELRTDSGVWQGRSLVHDDQTCWLLDATGALHEIKLADVTAHRLLEAPFRPETVVEARDRLRREAPRGMEVAAKGRYVVCAPVGQAAAYAALLDEVYNSFWRHFSRRNFGLQPPEFPLTATVFANREQFVAHARQDYPHLPANLQGYYHRRTNRITLYAESPLTASRLRGDDATEREAARSMDRGLSPPPATLPASIDAGARDTLIHEATHQLAFNLGLHSRLAETPRWITEGLAMLLEEDSRRDDTGGRNPSERINRSRYIWFRNYLQQRRPAKSLVPLLERDEPLSAAPLDFYSEAWALSFYLAETRPSEYARYLRGVAARDPLRPYPPEERLADFQAAFSRDLDHFEGQYLRFLKQIDL
jgi:hypothetical protein